VTVTILLVKRYLIQRHENTKSVFTDAVHREIDSPVFSFFPEFPQKKKEEFL